MTGKLRESDNSMDVAQASPQASDPSIQCPSLSDHSLCYDMNNVVLNGYTRGVQ
jgi:hypothetical protein